MTDLTRSTFQGTSLLILSQIGSRLITFIVNVMLVRTMNNDAKPLGISSTQFHLLYIGALSLTRDGVRRACLRELPAEISLENRENWAAGASLSLAYTGVGLFFVSPILFAYFKQNPPIEANQSDYMFGIILVVLGSCMELLSEPLYVIAQSCGMFKLRSLVEMIGSLSRAFAGLAAALLFGCRLTSFAWAYFANGLSILLAYFIGLIVISNDALFPLNIAKYRPSFKMDSNVGKVAALTTVQSAWKLALSEGEKLVMLLMGTIASDRGSFAMSANLGSLAARLILQPSEEAAFTLFGKLKHDKNRAQLFGVLTRVSIIFGLISVCFASQYTHLLILLLYGNGWANTDAPYILSWYCVFIGVCAVNGITEAFLQAVADVNETKSFNIWLFICSAVFVSASALLLPIMGTSGLVAANSIVMILRIVRNIVFASEHLVDRNNFSPSIITLGMFLFSFVVTSASNRFLYKQGATIFSSILHVCVGGFLSILVLLVIYVTDKDLVTFIRNLRLKEEKAD